MWTTKHQPLISCIWNVCLVCKKWNGFSHLYFPSVISTLVLLPSHVYIQASVDWYAWNLIMMTLIHLKVVVEEKWRRIMNQSLGVLVWWRTWIGVLDLWSPHVIMVCWCCIWHYLWFNFKCLPLFIIFEFQNVKQWPHSL